MVVNSNSPRFWRRNISKFPIFIDNIFLAIVLSLVSTGITVNSTALADTPASKAPSACQAAACTYLPLLSNTPVPPIRISKWELQRDRSGKCIVRGEIGTTSEKPVFAAQIEVRIYDQNDQLMDTRIGTSKLPATLPGQLNPFEIGTSADCLYGVPHGEVAITGWELVSVVTYASLSIDLAPNGIPGDIVDQVTARIQNDEPAPVENVQAIIWSMGQADGFWVQSVADVMTPGEVITTTQAFPSIQVGFESVHAAAIGVVPQQP